MTLQQKSFRRKPVSGSIRNRNPGFVGSHSKDRKTGSFVHFFGNVTGGVAQSKTTRRAMPRKALMTRWTSPMETIPSPLASALHPGGSMPRNMLMAL